MHVSRRRFLQLAAGAAALSVPSRIAQAQAYPARPVRLIVGLAAGGGQDIGIGLLVLVEGAGQRHHDRRAADHRELHRGRRVPPRSGCDERPERAGDTLVRLAQYSDDSQ